MIVKFILVPKLVRIPFSIGSLGLPSHFRRQIVQQSWKQKTGEILGRDKKIHLVENVESWNKISSEICRDIAAVKVVGFDTEWVVKNSKRNPIAMLQLATYSGNCVIFRLNRLQHIPPTLKEILEDRRIMKVGVSCDTDDRFISQDYNVDVRGWVDLRHLVLEDKANIKFSLDSLAFHYLEKNLNKFWRLKASNWESHTLAQSQVAYAAEDALVALHILFAQLEKLWNPEIQENWETLIRKAIEEICEPFVEIDFHYRRSNEDNSKSSDNIVKEMAEIQAPDGQFLSHCKIERASWYLNKGLADLISIKPMIIKLKFEPSIGSEKEGIALQSYFRNRPTNCVVCGEENCHIWKNVIPHEYRKYFPDILLSHKYDVVTLCNQCLKISNTKDNELKQILTKEIIKQVDARVVSNKRPGVISTEEELKNRNKLTLEQSQHMRKNVMECIEREAFTEDLVTQAANLNKQCTSDHFKIYKYYEKIGLIYLESLCRQWFLDAMKPKYMHEMWSVFHNYEWLKQKMSQYPLEHEIRKDFKVALVGTEGEIDIPYQPKKTRKDTRPLPTEEVREPVL